MSEFDAVLRDALRARLLRRMGHAVQHDLKLPVQGLYWCLDLALRGVATLSEGETARTQVEKAMATARKELARLEHTSRTLLADAGILEDEETRFDLAALTQDLTRHFATEAAVRKVQFVASLPLEPVPVRGPRSEIGQAVLACVVAAFDRVPAGGRVEVGVRVDGNSAVVDVYDESPAKEAVAASAGEYSLASIALRIARQSVESRGGEILSEERGHARHRATSMRLPLDSGPV